MRFFDNAYEGTPTWDIGWPQGAVVRLAERGAIEGSVLDVGCGTGENALYLAARGHAVTGIDFAAAAIEKARARARDRNIAAEFLVEDAFHLADLGRRLDAALDAGTFHTLQPEDRPRYAAAVAAAVRPGGRCFLLCWSERNPFGRGPERVARRDIRAAFRGVWVVESIEHEWLETLLPEGRVHAWLATIRRVEPAGGRARGASRAGTAPLPGIPAPPR